MAKRSWPSGVTCWEDTVLFAELVFGQDVPFWNYSDRLPHPSDKSFLLFAKGACAEGKPLRKMADLIEPQLQEIEEWDREQNFRWKRPNRSQQMLSADGKHVWYWSAQVVLSLALTPIRNTFRLHPTYGSLGVNSRQCGRPIC